MHIKAPTYTSDEISILWQPDKCIHSGKCVRDLQAIFNTKKIHGSISLAQLQLLLPARFINVRAGH